MSAYIAADVQRQVRARFSNCCAYCRTAEFLSVAIFEFEHIIPRSRGGQSLYENISLSCPTCNRYKGDRTTAIDPLTTQEVSLFHPQRDDWADHFDWRIDATAIAGLTPTGRATVELLRMNRPQMQRLRRMWVAMDEHPPRLD